MNRWKVVQFGVYSDFKFEEVGLLRDGGVLGQASAVLDLLFNKVRVNIFGTKGFKNTAVLSSDTTLTFTAPPTTGSTATESSLEHIVGVVDTIGGGVLFGVAPNTDIDGNIAWLRRQRPTPLSDGVGAMARVTQHLNTRFALYGEFTGVRTARKHTGWYTRGLPGANAFRHRMNTLDTTREQLLAVNEFFDAQLALSDRLVYVEDEADTSGEPNQPRHQEPIAA